MALETSTWHQAFRSSVLEGKFKPTPFNPRLGWSYLEQPTAHSKSTLCTRINSPNIKIPAFGLAESLYFYFLLTTKPLQVTTSCLWAGSNQILQTDEASCQPRLRGNSRSLLQVTSQGFPFVWFSPETLPKLMGVKNQREGGLFTSAWILVTDPAIPFSVLMLLELLLGELGPDPGALLHAESEKHIQTQLLTSETISVVVFRQITTPQVLFWTKAALLLLPFFPLNLPRALKIPTNTFKWFIQVPTQHI